MGQMDSLKSIDELLADRAAEDQSFPQRKEPKENTEGKGQLPVDQLINRPVGKGITAVNSQPNTGQTIKVDEQKVLEQAERRAASLKTLEIDDYLFGLITEELLDEDWLAFGAKCCYTLGLQRVNKLVIQVRSTDCTGPGQSPKRLLSWKLKGAMQLHFKKQYYEQGSTGDN